MGFLMDERTLHYRRKARGGIGLDLYQDCWDRGVSRSWEEAGIKKHPLHSICAYMAHHLNRMIRNIHLSTSPNPTFSPY